MYDAVCCVRWLVINGLVSVVDGRVVLERGW